MTVNESDMRVDLDLEVTVHVPYGSGESGARTIRGAMARAIQQFQKEEFVSWRITGVHRLRLPDSGSHGDGAAGWTGWAVAAVVTDSTGAF